MSDHRGGDEGHLRMLGSQSRRPPWTISECYKAPEQRETVQDGEQEVLNRVMREQVIGKSTRFDRTKTTAASTHSAPPPRLSIPRMRRRRFRVEILRNEK